jgi:HPt (histidine-containing phosphotransfer) domain-containing protein
MMHWMGRAVLGLFILAAVSSKAWACGKQGVCDLTGSGTSWDESIPVMGEWQFFWKQLLTPEDLRLGKGQLTGYLSPDADWRITDFAGADLHSVPYATYHIQFLVSAADPLTIRFPRLPSAAVLWVNDQKVASIGQLSTEGKEALAGQRVVFHSFVPNQGLNTITIQLSNYSYYFHSGMGGVAIGRPEIVQSEFQSIMVRDALTFGAILIMAFYHFYLWWIRRSRMAPLYFGLFCFAMGLRSLGVGQGQILSHWFPNSPLELQLKIEYLSIAIPSFALLLLVRDLYPKEFPKWVAYPLAAAAFLWVLLILLTTAEIFPKSLRPYQILLMISGCSIITALITAAVRKSEGAIIFLLGFGSLFGASVVDILVTMNFFHSPPLAHIGTFAMVFFQAILLSRRFDKAFDQAEQAEKEVRFLNEGLERIVKERTDQVNIILRNVSSGFLLIDRQGILQPGFTDSCHKLIGVNLTPGARLSDMLPLDKQTKAMLRETIIQVFDDCLPTEVSLAQIPYPLPISGRMLGISGAALRDDTGRLWAILFTITDVTRLQEAEKKIAYNEMLIGILREQVAFKVFLEDFRKEIQLALVALQANNQGGARNLLHTMKGNLGIFGMRQLAEFIHEIEGRELVTVADINELSQKMESLLDENKGLLGLDKKDLTFEVRLEDYNEIMGWASRNLDARHYQELTRLLKRSCQKPIRTYIGPLQSTIEMLGNKLDKCVECEITGADMHVDESFAPVLRNLIHLIRNSVDHGIEPPEARGAKSRTGKIMLAFTQTDKELEIRVEDDGRGLNAEAIKDKAKKLGLITGDGRDLTEDEVHRLIFSQGFSTADEVSDISGRGVGMSAILEAVEDLSGTLQINSKKGLGLQVIIRIPLQAESYAEPGLPRVV